MFIPHLPRCHSLPIYIQAHGFERLRVYLPLRGLMQRLASLEVQFINTPLDTYNPQIFTGNIGALLGLQKLLLTSMFINNHSMTNIPTNTLVEIPIHASHHS